MGRMGRIMGIRWEYRLKRKLWGVRMVLSMCVVDSFWKRYVVMCMEGLLLRNIIVMELDLT